MPSTFGTTLRVTVFGQSHSKAIGCVLDGLPSGLHLDMDALTHFIARRTPGSFSGDTTRHERDSFRILSGLTSKGTTCGAPLAAIIENTDVRTGDYNYLSTTPRPGHADFAAWYKWHGRQDASGGGQFSGRLTAALCLAGGIAIQALSTQEIHIAAHLKEVAGIKDDTLAVFDASPASRLLLSKQISHLHTKQGPPILNDLAGEKILSAIREARDAGDSVGGLVECVATGIPAGMGSPLFEGLESTIAHAIFSIPAVKGIEFGLGFEAARTRGSKNNDPYVVQDGEVQPATNNAGGILGGISTGAPLFFTCAFKPISSISLPQRSVDLSSNTQTTLEVHGRHDTCAALRAVPVVEAVCALALLDAELSWPQESKRNPYEVGL